ncbi:MAG: alpha/beta fold hydrolase [Candidatus Puniceispirillaceae bacterium]
MQGFKSLSGVELKMAKLVLVPGLLCTDILFTPQISALQDEVEISIAKTTGMDSITAMAERLLDEQSGRFILAGLSMGGYVAMETARLAPDRVAGLGLLSTAADQDTKKKKKLRTELIRLSSIGKFKGVTPRLLPQFLSPEALLDKVLTARVMEMAATVGQVNFALQQTAIMGRRDQRDMLADYRRPALVLCGDLDVLTPPEKSEEMAGLLPNSELVLLPETGHLSTLEAPQACIEALQRLIARSQASI